MQTKRPRSKEQYAANRRQLLAQITQYLQEDDRFVAAWLTGSFGRQEADHVSDLDLTVVVDDNFARTLCARPFIVGVRTTTERYALFSRFGQPQLIHENNQNAPTDGSFTFVLYNDSALAVDWVLRPRTNASRPDLSELLFDRGNIPVEPAREQHINQLRQVCREMIRLMPEVEAMGGDVPVSPMDSLEILLHFTETTGENSNNQ